MVSPNLTRTAPSACLASLPVSMDRVREPSRSSRVCMVFISFQVAGRPGGCGFRLLADTQPVDQLGVPFRVLALEVIQQASPLSDEFQEPAARMVILCVNLEMFREVTDPLAEDRNLNLRGSCVSL